MTRDESTEGWLPLQGGGLANVSIRKRARMPDVGGHEYIIYGQRISDQTVSVLTIIYHVLNFNNAITSNFFLLLLNVSLTRSCFIFYIFFRSYSVASLIAISNIIK